MEEPFSFGAWLRQRRKTLDLTQAEFARQLGCATITLQKIELDERRPSKAMAEHMATVLAVPTAERARFVKSARGALAADQLPHPVRPREPWDPGAPPLQPLPIPPTPLIGREREIADVIARLRHPDVRLLTLTGPGGSGKTRLALAAAGALGDTFAAGIAFVPLTTIRDPALVLPAIAQELGVIEGRGQSIKEALQTALRDRHLLLVLDNFEQVLSAAVQVADLLRAAPAINVLTTSRAPLQIQGEHEFAVPPLALPSPTMEAGIAQVTQSESGALFIARVQAIMRDFIVTTANAPTIAAICTRLDGLPLAIELAARRCKVFPPHTLLIQLEHRLEVLTGGSHDLPARQQTLRATIDWSYKLLAPDEQWLFARLAIFTGGWTIAAAEAVCMTPNTRRLALVAGMQALLDHSLLRAHESRVGTVDVEPRFTMFETIRDYACEALEVSGEADAV